jgi:hypothetical protein
VHRATSQNVAADKLGEGWTEFEYHQTLCSDTRETHGKCVELLNTIKVKFTLEHVIKAQKGSRDIALLFL